MEFDGFQTTAVQSNERLIRQRRGGWDVRVDERLGSRCGRDE